MVGKSEEVDCDCYAKQRGEACPPIRNVTHPLRYYEFTPEEMKALEECDRESFYQRCLPLSALLGATTYGAIKTGLASASPHWGALPKVASAALAGYVLGRAASVPSCARRLRRLPASSHLGRTMRDHHAAASRADTHKTK